MKYECFRSCMQLRKTILKLAIEVSLKCPNMVLEEEDQMVVRFVF